MVGMDTGRLADIASDHLGRDLRASGVAGVYERGQDNMSKAKRASIDCGDYTAAWDGLCWALTRRDIQQTGKHAGEERSIIVGYYVGPLDVARAMIEDGLAQSEASGMVGIQTAIDEAAGRLEAALVRHARAE